MIGFKTLLEHELKRLYCTAEQVCEVLPGVTEAITNINLKHVFKIQLTEAREHYDILKGIFDNMGIQSKGECRYTEVLTKDALNLINVNAQPEVKDAGFLSFAIRILCHQMALYRAARYYTLQCGHEAINIQLEKIIDVLREADSRLSNAISEITGARAVA